MPHPTKENVRSAATEMDDIDSDSETRPLLSRGISSVSIIGTVRLTEDIKKGSIIYIPAATADPRDPLNMKPWQKMLVTVVVSSFSTIGLSLISGFGGLLGFYIPQYLAAGKSPTSITKLLTYPTLFMGLGNLVGMPFAIAVGRRVVLLVATLIMLLSAILCATANSFEWHLAARMLLGIAAGQSESVGPMIIQEIYFLHERSQGLAIQQCIQTIAGAIWVLCASPISGAVGPQWWYGFGAILTGAQLLVSFFLLPETKYDRTLAKYRAPDIGNTNSRKRVSCTVRPPLDFDRFEPRTWQSDMRLWTGSPEWPSALRVLKQAFGMMFFPNVLWVLCLTGFTLGVNVAIATTYGRIITSPPYNWPDSTISYLNSGQIVIALTGLPLLGYGSDKYIRWRATLNGGIHEPETRLIPLVLPIVIGTFTIALYGQGASHPFQYHWFLYLWAVAGYFFAFVGSSIVGITYLLDSYPTRAGPLLLIICVFRGILSFATSYGTANFIDSIGYDGIFTCFAGLTAVFGLLAIPVYVFGKRIRAFTGRWAKDIAI